MRDATLRVGLIATAAVLGADRVLAQCVMCRLALESPEGRRMLAAFQGGILFLLAAPFVVFGVIAALAVRRRRLLSEAAPETAGFPARSPDLVKTA